MFGARLLARCGAAVLRASPVAIAAFAAASAPVTSCGAGSTTECYSWGYGQFGQLGQGDARDRTLPADIQDLDGVKVKAAVSHGCSDCSAVVTETGDLYTFGRGRDGRLGHGKTARGSPENLPRLVSGLQGTVVDVALGEFHGAAVTRDGSLFTWGKDKPELLGHDKSNGLPAKVDGVSDVAKVACGRLHTAILTSDGRVLTFGTGKFGQLGHGERSNEAAPKVVSALSGKRVVDIACGKEHTVAVTSDGDLYAFGFDFDGQLGQGRSSRYQSTPVLVRAMRGKKVVRVAAGANFSMAVTDDGEVFSWGLGTEGQLGHGDAASVAIPKQILALQGTKVVDVQCGEGHSVVLTAEGQLLAFGRGRNGQLGRADRLESQAAARPSPRQVHFFDQHTVKSFACGANHTLAVVEK